jgi:hypothetical protein
MFALLYINQIIVLQYINIYAVLLLVDTRKNESERGVTRNTNRSVLFDMSTRRDKTKQDERTPIANTDDRPLIR